MVKMAKNKRKAFYCSIGLRCLRLLRKSMSAGSDPDDERYYGKNKYGKVRLDAESAQKNVPPA